MQDRKEGMSRNVKSLKDSILSPFSLNSLSIELLSCEFLVVAQVFGFCNNHTP